MKNYKLVLFDMDGTLYYQTPLRLCMGACLLAYYLFRPGSFKEIGILMEYRRVREGFTGGEAGRLEGDILAETADRTKSTSDQVEKVVRRWIYEEPLDKLSRYQDPEAAELMKDMRAKGMITAVYSDYPAEDKVKALKLAPDFCFFPGGEGIDSLKPDPSGIRYITSRLGVKPEDTLMIGDRMEKDGLAAAGAGADYVILSKNKRKRKKQYRELRAFFLKNERD